jgi:excisionase family DNA binding protein
MVSTEKGLLDMNRDSVLLSRKEAAEILGVTPGTLAVWACTRRHNLPFIKVGRAVRYRRKDLEAWMASRTVNGTARSQEEARIL